MANPAHEALLRQGLGEWNEWRAANASVTPDLTGTRLSAARLEGADLSHACLRGATLIRSRLGGADLRYADLRDAKLHEADFTDADLFRANLENAFLSGAKLRRARLFGANLKGAQLTVVDLRRADLREANLEKADLRESLGLGASFEGARMAGAELSGCRLEQCNLLATEGLDAAQLSSAVVDDTALLPDSFREAAPDSSLSSLAKALEALRARVTGDVVSETELLAYHSLLRKLAAHGLSVDDARVDDGELVRPVTSWERTAGGEAFELAPHRWLGAQQFYRRVDRLLEQLRGKVD